MSNSTSSNEKHLRPLEDEHDEKIAAASAGDYNVNEKSLLRKIDLKVRLGCLNIR